MKIKNFISAHPKLWEIFKFLLVGGGATVVDFIFTALTMYLFAPKAYPNFLSVFVGGNYIPTTAATVIGTAVGFIFGLIFNYIFSVIFVFTSSDTGKAKTGAGFAIFAALSAVGLALHVFGMYVGFDLLGINEWIIKIFMTVIVLVFNYFTRKTVLFNKQKQ